jgi:ABC-type polysaccharide/polyol phosphate export permease
MMLNPFAHLAVAYQQVLYEPGGFRDWWHLLVVGAAALVVLFIGFFVFDRLRDTLAEAV